MANADAEYKLRVRLDRGEMAEDTIASIKRVIEKHRCIGTYPSQDTVEKIEDLIYVYERNISE